MNIAMKKPDVFRCRTLRRTETGASALIVVLWVVCLLSIMLSSFAFDAHVEARITSYYRKRTKADWLAKSGMEVATLLMAKRDDVRGKADKDKDPDDRWFEPAKRLSEGLAIRGLEEKLGEGKIELDIVPEPARRNVNLLKEDDWERMLEVSGVPEEMWDELIDCALDWIDKDETVRIKGAETEDYYSRLDQPYKAKNGPLDTVGELLLVKRFNSAILYGGTIKIGSETDSIFADEKEEPIAVTGIDDMLTTYGDGKVNVNAASRRVLMTLPDVDDLVADAIIEEREGLTNEKGQKEDTSFKNVADFQARVPEASTKLKDYVTTDSGIFRINSAGVVHGVRRQVSCIVEYANKNLTILRWREEN